MVEFGRHHNIEALTYAEVNSVEGDVGNFKVTVTKKPRYINEDKCTGCGTCMKYCPVEYPDQYNQELCDNKAIHIYFSQAIPLVTYIDESCLRLKEGKCDICMGVCQPEAIDFRQTAEKVELNVGTIILSAGVEPFDPSAVEEYTATASWRTWLPAWTMSGCSPPPDHTAVRSFAPRTVSIPGKSPGCSVSVPGG